MLIFEQLSGINVTQKNGPIRWPTSKFVEVKMPRLHERVDGCFCVIGFCYEGFSTWQIDRAGVLFLKERNVQADDKFSSELFFELWRRKLIYKNANRAESRRR